MKYKETKDYLLINDKMQNMFDYIDKESVEAIITDPPYELGFMGKSWDSSGVAFQVDTWQKCYDALKPGGYLLAFGGSRTYHRIACAIEDAGFEIRDCIMWLYGSGFPKSMNIGLAIDKKLGLQGQRGVGGFNVGGIQEQQNRKAKLYIGSTSDGSKQKAYTDYKSELSKNWSGWGSQLKPAYEPIIVARKPFKGSLVDNVIEYGVGGLNIDECRVGNTNADNYDLNKRQITSQRTKREDDTFLDGLHNNDIKHGVTEQGRFPANVILTYDETDFDEVCGGFPDTNPTKKHSGDAKSLDTRNMGWGFKRMPCNIEDNGGSASRYFYCAKASKKDRDEGLELFDSLKVNDGRQTPIDNPFQRGESLRKNIHPTVKPVELMQYLVRLVAPKGSTVMDCFMGSGSTGKAVMFENRERDANYKFIGIEMTDEYLPICESRIEYALNKYEYDAEIENKKDHEEGRLNIFDFIEEDVE